MNRLRSLISGSLRSRPVLAKLKFPEKQQKIGHHDDGPPQPFDNMPFSMPNRYAATFIFSVFFGVGLWAPFAILWYSMAKRTL